MFIVILKHTVILISKVRAILQSRVVWSSSVSLCCHSH